MTDINIQELRQAAEAATKETWSHLDGIVYAHTEETEWELFEGRAYSLEDAKFVVAANPAVVLALLDALEKLQRVNSAQDDHINQQADAIEALERKNAELGKYSGQLEKRVAELEAQEIKPQGMKLITEALGAHAYIVGVLVQGRPDLALEESRKWVSLFERAATGIKGE